MIRFSLKWQILALVLATVVVVVVSLTLLTITQLHSQLHAGIDRKAVSVSALLAENLGPGVEFGDSAFIQSIASTAFVDPDIVGITLRDAGGRLLYQTLADSDISDDVDGVLPVPRLEVAHNEDFFYVSRPVISRGHTVGYLRLVVSEEAMLAQLYRGVAVIMALALTLLALTFIVGIVLSRRMVSPIRTFSRAATRISSGDMAESIDLTGLQKDFEPLGAAFNGMQKALSQAFDELRQSRSELEHQVEERTAALRTELDERKKAEVALERNRELLRATLESAADGILAVDSRGVTTHFNRRFAEMWRLPDDLLETGEDNRLLAYVLDQLVEPQTFLGKVRQLYASRDTSTDRLLFKDGRVYERYSCPLIREDRLIGRVWSFRDITELVRSIERLQFTQFTIDHSAEPAFWMSNDARLIYVNEAACRTLGYTRQELLGMTMHDIDPNFPREAWPMQWRQLQLKGSLTYQSTHRKKDGREYPVEISANYLEFQGQEFNCAFSRDITERRRIEQAQVVLLRVAEAANQATSLEELLRTTRRQLGTIIDTTNFYVALWDEEKQIYTFPYARDEHEDEDFSPQRLENSLTDYVRRNGQPLLIDEAYHEKISAAGEVGLIGYPSLIWMGVPMLTSTGTIGVMVVQHYHNAQAYTQADLDWMTSIAQPIARVAERLRGEEQQRQLREELDRAERMKSLGVLAGGVAHDLNNMLGPLVGYPELILLRLAEDSPIRKQVVRIGTAAKQAASVVQDLLTLARRGRYEMVPTDLNTVVDSYLDTPGFTKLTESKPNVTVTTALDRTIGAISGSSPHLSKVVMNLVVNAFDAMPDGGALTISTHQQQLERLVCGYDKVEPGPYAVLTVKDSGIGIDPADIDKIFEPYYSKKKMGTSGSGLGLSVVYGVVKDHKGYYDVTSQPGQGTAFILYFPISAARVEDRQQSSDELRGTETVLVVDDDDGQREIAAELLASCGYRVQLAANGHKALEFLAAQKVDLVVLDMIMEKDFDGLDTYREILKGQPAQKAIIISGYSPTERVQAMHDLGVTQFVKKPYTRQSLATAVRAELNRTPGEEVTVVTGPGAGK